MTQRIESGPNNETFSNHPPEVLSGLRGTESASKLNEALQSLGVLPNGVVFFMWLACTGLLTLGLTRPMIEISVNVTAVLQDAVNQQPIVGLLLQEKGVRLSELAMKLPPSSTSQQSVVSSVTKLYSAGAFSAATLVLFFSVLTPIGKQVFLVGVLFSRSTQRKRCLEGLKAIHKWSMVDVFVLAIVVLTLSSASAWDARVQDGFYWFLGYFLLAAVTSAALSQRVLHDP